MTISSSLNAGVAGLAANASRLATISDNIANSGTHGYKRAEADFHSMVISSGNGTYSAGGVRVTTQRVIDQPGALLSTNNPTDLAVRGRGFLPVTPASALKVQGEQPPMLLTTTGSFRTDKDGILQTETGMVLLGWPAEPDGTIKSYPRDTADGLQPVKINTNQFAGEPTTKLSLGVNLPATSTEYGSLADTEVLSIEYFDNMGTSQNLAVTYVPEPATNPGDPASNTWRMIIRDSASGNNIVGAYELRFNNDREAGGTLQSVSTIAVDSNGERDPLGMTYGGGWDLTTGEFRVNVANGAPPNENPIDITIGGEKSTTGITQLSDSFAPTSILKDGSPVGNMVSVDVDANGFVYANFDTGITRKIYQIPLVDLPNPNGLIALDNQTYTTSNVSGSFFLWDAADGPTGDIVSYALEESATDVAGELTNLIQTQRAYSSNAKVIQTVDEMLQETTNIKR
ncbi:flagellar hook protein FlgE [Roseitranquillus sediminis]|uniref:flagellar hook protein FlgE n=1 Tax=Roseitranquillus sediminis TaxID=2809051 RepID=UPI001D0C1469|nr:flagellar hook-basal body complex protein [Roseitranquillus sediminis]MBM9596101.1 flagellar hook-basal body complex protein [Roseitranquillus sediminis]